MKRLHIFITWLWVGLMLIGCAPRGEQGNATPTPPRPDLRVTTMRVELENPGCLRLGDALGVRVGVENAGDVDAVPFVVTVNGVSQTTEGLAAGKQMSLFFRGYEVYPQMNTAVVDAQDEVKEADEENNRLEESLPVPTPPVVCTPQAAELPDLIPLSMAYSFENATCMEPGATMGVRLTLKNAGAVPAGPFVVTVNGVQQVVQDGLGSGESITIFVPGYADPSEVEVDSTALVEEVDETNNVLQMQLPVPTAPVPCTPTPSAHFLLSRFHPT
ncbi:MAG: hypothetical protein KC418_12095 [Anaerolineales bacterium]|nr:hypothetical protein [Anaerolineales bacterium]MCB8954425.1 hypothetical protein [Ardenticatenales bacterium]